MPATPRWWSTPTPGTGGGARSTSRTARELPTTRSAPGGSAAVTARTAASSERSPASRSSPSHEPTASRTRRSAPSHSEAHAGSPGSPGPSSATRASTTRAGSPETIPAAPPQGSGQPSPPSTHRRARGCPSKKRCHVAEVTGRPRDSTRPGSPGCCTRGSGASRSRSSTRGDPEPPDGCRSWLVVSARIGYPSLSASASTAGTAADASSGAGPARITPRGTARTAAASARTAAGSGAATDAQTRGRGHERSSSGQRGERGVLGVVRHRLERLPKRRVEVDRTGPRPERPRHRERGRHPHPGQRRQVGARRPQVVEQPHVPREEVGLHGGLGRLPVVQLGRAVGRHHDERDPCLVRLEHRRQVVGAGGPGGADQHGGPTRRPGLAEGEEPRHPLVHQHGHAQLRPAGQGQHQRRAARPRAHHGVADPGRHQPVHHQLGPPQVQVGGGHVLTPSAARQVRALARVSRSSEAASEAATMPAPA